MIKKTSQKTSPSKVEEEKQVKRRVCVFCEAKRDPDYKDFETLRRFVTDRDRIVGRKRSGLCAKHQRRVATAVKRAREIGTL